MSNVIKLKRSATAGHTPTLADGEVAINTADGLLFVQSGATQLVYALPNLSQISCLERLKSRTML